MLEALRGGYGHPLFSAIFGSPGTAAPGSRFALARWAALSVLRIAVWSGAAQLMDGSWALCFTRVAQTQVYPCLAAGSPFCLLTR